MFPLLQAAKLRPPSSMGGQKWGLEALVHRWGPCPRRPLPWIPRHWRCVLLPWCLARARGHPLLARTRPGTSEPTAPPCLSPSLFTIEGPVVSRINNRFCKMYMQRKETMRMWKSTPKPYLNDDY